MNDIEKNLNEAGFQTFRIDKASVRDAPTWQCKIGLHNGKKAVLPRGSDFPMREAITKEFKRLCGQNSDFIFSGWGAKLTQKEKHCEYDEQGGFGDAMIGDILDEIIGWSPEMLNKLVQAINTQRN